VPFDSANIDTISWGSKADLFAPDCLGPIGWEITPTTRISAAINAAAAPLVLGESAPDWMYQPLAYHAQRQYAVRFDGAYLNPEWGIVFTDRSVLFEPSADAARYKSPDLSQVDGYNSPQADSLFSIDNSSDRYFSGTYLVLNHWGGKNFGHFIYDSLPSVFIFLSEIVRGTVKLIAAPLKDWQWAFLDRMGIPRGSIIETDERVCKCERLIFPSTLCDNLNFPTLLTRSMIEYLKISGKGQDREKAPKQIYVSRRGYDNRQMRNEAQLSNALSALGFTRICPELLSVDDQISTFSNAEVIVGEIGAALSNAAFAPEGCRVIEIIPELKSSIWIKNLSALLRYEWRCVHETVPPDNRQICIIDGVTYDNLVFSYNVDVERVIEAISWTEK
jgi:capsular polysaccharide biosynthesis protein